MAVSFRSLLVIVNLPSSKVASFWILSVTESATSSSLVSKVDCFLFKTFISSSCLAIYKSMVSTRPSDKSTREFNLPISVMHPVWFDDISSCNLSKTVGCYASPDLDFSNKKYSHSSKRYRISLCTNFSSFLNSTRSESCLRMVGCTNS